MTGFDATSVYEQTLTGIGHLLQPSSFGSFALERICKNPDLSGQEREEFLDFIGAMIRVDPRERPDARALLTYPWLSRSDNKG